MSGKEAVGKVKESAVDKVKESEKYGEVKNIKACALRAVLELQVPLKVGYKR